MPEVEQLGAFVTNVSYEAISPHSRQALKSHVLDSLGCAMGALGGEPIKLLRAHIEEFGGAPLVTLIGGGRTAPDRVRVPENSLTGKVWPIQTRPSALLTQHFWRDAESPAR